MYDFVFVDETRIAVTGDGFIELGNVETGEVEPKIYVPKILSRGGGGIGFSPDGRLLLLGTDTGVVRVELASNRRDSHDWLAGSNREFGNAGRSRLISPHGDRFIYYDSKPRVLDFRDDSQRLLTQTEFIAAPDTRVQILGRWLLYLSSDSSHDNINGLNLATGEAVVDIRSGVGPGRLSGDGIPFISKAGRLHVAVGSKTSVEKLHIEVLPNSNGSVEHQIFPQFEALSGFHLNIGRMHWADDGAEYWQNSNDGKQVRFWDVRTGKVLRTISRGVEIGEGLHFFPGSTLLIRRRSTKNNSEIEYLIQNCPVKDSQNSLR